MSEPTTRRKKRPPLNRRHYEIYWMIFHSFEMKNERPPVFARIDVPEETAARVLRLVIKLAQIAGVDAGQKKPAKMFDDALKAVYVRGRAEPGFDTAPAFSIAERIGKLLRPYRDERDRRQRERHEREVEKPARERRKAEAERRLNIQALRDRLENLDEDDFRYEGARFKLEKQIYDLERDLGRDDWPEYIDG